MTKPLRSRLVRFRPSEGSIVSVSPLREDDPCASDLARSLALESDLLPVELDEILGRLALSRLRPSGHTTIFNGNALYVAVIDDRVVVDPLLESGRPPRHRFTVEDFRDALLDWNRYLVEVAGKPHEQHHRSAFVRYFEDDDDTLYVVPASEGEIFYTPTSEIDRYALCLQEAMETVRDLDDRDIEGMLERLEPADHREIFRGKSLTVSVADNMVIFGPGPDDPERGDSWFTLSDFRDALLDLRDARSALLGHRRKHRRRRKERPPDRGAG